jgi:uncharacterized protein (DUF1330 family)
MAAYIHADIEVTDPALYETYRQQVPAVVAAHGGRFLVRGGAAELLEGERTLRRQVILEFPDMAHLQAFYHSPEYQVLVRLRQSASKGSLIALQGA